MLILMKIWKCKLSIIVCLKVISDLLNDAIKITRENCQASWINRYQIIAYSVKEGGVLGLPIEPTHGFQTKYFT